MEEKILVIAEKPSVAASIAKALGVEKSHGGYLEGEGCIVSWCVGHLVGLASADYYDARYSRWAREDLPIFPEAWQFTVPDAAKEQFGILRGLMERPDVSEVVNACDAGREGELIFRLVYEKAGCMKPMKRLWISSMEDGAIRRGMRELMPGAAYDSLYAAALCRAKADWLVGINATRLFTLLCGGKTLNVGRVMTPTLAFIARREEEITDFKKEKFYTVELDFGAFHASSGRLKGRTDAEKLRKSCLGKTFTITKAERGEGKEKPPELYDLTSLQREANRLYGYTAQQTLDYLQLLYEKKLATYPRTDSRYLTEDMEAGLCDLCRCVAGALPFASGFLGAVDAGRVIDNAKVSDHHAILPTAGIAQTDVDGLPTGERNILFLAAARLLCAVCPDDYTYTETEIAVEGQGHAFAARERRETAEGWKGMERAFLRFLGKRQGGKKDAQPLPEISGGQAVTAGAAVLHEGNTSPPARFTEDTLLGMMESAGAEDMPEDAERRGIGTPATRAGIIEKLVKGGFIERKGKYLVPTRHGMESARMLPDSLKSAKLTAEWEEGLRRVERGEASPEGFMDKVKGMVGGLVESYKGVQTSGETLTGAGKEPLGECPRCGKPVYEGKKSFYCSGYKEEPPCRFALWKDGAYFKSKRKELTRDVVSALLRDGKAQMKGLYSEKKGVLYDATVVMEDTGGKQVNFRMEFGGKSGGGRKN